MGEASKVSGEKYRRTFPEYDPVVAVRLEIFFPSKTILISGFLSPDSNQSSAPPLVTVKKKKKPRINNIRFGAIVLFQLYNLHVNK